MVVVFETPLGAAVLRPRSWCDECRENGRSVLPGTTRAWRPRTAPRGHTWTAEEDKTHFRDPTLFRINPTSRDAFRSGPSRSFGGRFMIGQYWDAAIHGVGNSLTPPRDRVGNSLLDASASSIHSSTRVIESRSNNSSSFFRIVSVIFSPYDESL